MIGIGARVALGLGYTALLLGAGGWLGYEWRDGQAAKDDLARQQAEAKDAHRRSEIALRASQHLEDDRAAILARARAADARAAAAMRQPVPQCPALEVRDVVLPPGSLDRVRRAAGELPPAADAGEPRQAVPGRATDP